MTKAETINTIHKTVLLNEAIDDLNLPEKPVVVDATFGGGGHSLEVCKRFPDAKIIAFDQDKSVFAKVDKWQGCNISFINENFRNIDEVLKKEGVSEVDGIIFDLGLSSDQLEVSDEDFLFAG